MNISLTYKCKEGCVHCFERATMQEDEMDYKTLREVILFVNEVKPLLIEISGGEFTLHSKWYQYCTDLILSIEPINVILLSNGSFCGDEQKERQLAKLCDRPNVFGVQIVTDKRYYPNYDKIMASQAHIESIHPKINVYEGVGSIINLGRAVDNCIAMDVNRSPMCTNLRIIASHPSITSFAALVAKMQSNGKFCTPHIDPQGYLHFGETRYCETIGHVSDSAGVLFNNIKGTSPCGKCGYVINMSHVRVLPMTNQSNET